MLCVFWICGLTQVSSVGLKEAGLRSCTVHSVFLMQALNQVLDHIKLIKYFV